MVDLKIRAQGPKSTIEFTAKGLTIIGEFDSDEFNEARLAHVLVLAADELCKAYAERNGIPYAGFKAELAKLEEGKKERFLWGPLRRRARH